MAKVSISQTSFTSGELDPRLAARHDYDGFYKGAETLTNVVCLGQGGVKRRGGFRFVSDINENKVRLVTFEFNVTQTYLLVFASEKMYVFKDGIIQTSLNGTSNNYIATPWNGGKIADISFTQSADTLIICHPEVAPRSIVRGGSHATWTLSTIVFSFLPTYDFNRDYDANTFAIGTGWDAVDGDVTITCNAANKITSEHVGGMFEGNGGVIRIESVNSAKTTLTGKLIKEFVTQTTLDGVVILAL